MRIQLWQVDEHRHPGGHLDSTTGTHRDDTHHTSPDHTSQGGDDLANVADDEELVGRRRLAAGIRGLLGHLPNHQRGLGEKAHPYFAFSPTPSLLRQHVSAVLSPEDARRLALALPDATEQDHHGRPSFRISGRIFATLWDPHHMNVMLDEAGIRTAVEAHPAVCREVWWGKRLAAVQADLRDVDEPLLTELLTDAWEGKRRPRRAMA